LTILIKNSEVVLNCRFFYDEVLGEWFMSIGIIQRSFGAHDGAFHADDVTACALLLHFEMIDRDKILRTRDLRRLATCDFVCDVGGEYDSSRRRFDHHQANYTGDLSSAGMVLGYLFEEKIITEDFYNFLNRSLIHGIDQIDIGKSQPQFGHCSFSQLISYYVPISYQATDVQFEDGFNEALDFTLHILQRITLKFNYVQKCESIVSTVMKQMDECLVFETAMPWVEAFFACGGEKHTAEFVIMPDREHWKLRGIPPSYERRMEVRRPLPKEWAGLLDDDLKKASNIPGAIFCHKGRFVSIWETKEDAIRALKIVLATK